MQEYKLVIRGITGGATVLDPQTHQVVAQNAGEFMSYLNEAYLSQGYTVLTVQHLRTFGQPELYEFAYHLVREFTPVKTMKS